MSWAWAQTHTLCEYTFPLTRTFNGDFGIIAILVVHRYELRLRWRGRRVIWWWWGTWRREIGQLPCHSRCYWPNSRYGPITSSIFEHLLVATGQREVASHVADFSVTVCRLWKRARRVRIEFKISCERPGIFRVAFNYCTRGFVIFVLNCSDGFSREGGCGVVVLVESWGGGCLGGPVSGTVWRFWFDCCLKL